MFESRIAADQPMVAAIAGFPPAIDALAADNLSGHGFLRAAWYRGGADQQGQTVVVQRSQDSAVIAAIPTIAFGPAIARSRKLAGSYWPHRSPLIAADCDPLELAQALEHDVTRRSLGSVWRIGPARMDDAATLTVIKAAQLAGWTVLSRAAGTSWVIDCDAARAAGWPRPSTRKRIARIERRLAKHGAITWQHVRGCSWNDSVLADLAAIEAASWIGTETNSNGAKFMTAQQRRVWQEKLSDPVLADLLHATILRVDGRAAAFTFDLDDGPVKYGIAGSYISEFRQFEPGKLANYRTLADAIAQGQQVLDLGAGDSGYKRDMGAVEGYQLADLLFVRSRFAARLLARVWGAAVPAQVTARG